MNSNSLDCLDQLRIILGNPDHSTLHIKLWLVIRDGRLCQISGVVWELWGRGELLFLPALSSLPSSPLCSLSPRTPSDRAACSHRPSPAAPPLPPSHCRPACRFWNVKFNFLRNYCPELNCFQTWELNKHTCLPALSPPEENEIDEKISPALPCAHLFYHYFQRAARLEQLTGVIDMFQSCLLTNTR